MSRLLTRRFHKILPTNAVSLACAGLLIAAGLGACSNGSNDKELAAQIEAMEG